MNRNAVTLDDLWNRRRQQPTPPTLIPNTVPVSGYKLWRKQGGKLTKANRLYYQTFKRWFDLHDTAAPQAHPDERLQQHLNPTSGADRLPPVRAYQLAQHRREQTNIGAISARLRRGKQALSLCITTTGPDAGPFIQWLNSTYCDANLYYEPTPGGYTAWLRLDLARPVQFKRGPTSLFHFTSRQNHKLNMMHGALIVLADLAGHDVQIHISGHANEVETTHRYDPRPHYTLLRRGRHMPLPRCPEDAADVTRWKASRCPGDMLMGKLMHDALSFTPEPDAPDLSPAAQQALDFISNVHNQMGAGFIAERQPGPNVSEKKRAYFTIGEDFPIALAIIRSTISRHRLNQINQQEQSKLGGVPITYEMLALGLCTYASNCYSGWQLYAVPALSIRRMLQHFGFTATSGKPPASASEHSQGGTTAMMRCSRRHGRRPHTRSAAGRVTGGTSDAGSRHRGMSAAGARRRWCTGRRAAAEDRSCLRERRG